MNKRSPIAASAAVAFGLLVPASPSLAKPAVDVEVEWRYEEGGRGTPSGCFDPRVTSDKDISNLVYTIRTVDEFGVETLETFTIEFADEEQGTSFDLDDLDGEIVEVWVKSGNNKSGDGGLGEYFTPVADDPVVENNTCVGGGGGTGSGTGNA